MAGAAFPDYSSLLSKIESKLAPQNVPSKKQVAERSLTVDHKRSIEGKSDPSVAAAYERSSSSMGPAKSPISSHPPTQFTTLLQKPSGLPEGLASLKASMKGETFGERDIRFPGLIGLVEDTVSGFAKSHLIQERPRSRSSIGIPPAPRSPMEPSSRLGLLSFNDVTPPASLLSPQHGGGCPPYTHTPQQQHRPQPQAKAQKEHSATNLGLLGETEPMHEMGKNSPASQLVSQTLLPLVMDNVRRCWQQFRKEMVHEVRREFALCSTLKIQECLEEVQRVQTMVCRNRDDCLRAVERKADEIKKEYQSAHEQLKHAYHSVLTQMQSMKEAQRNQTKSYKTLDSSFNKENLLWAMHSNITPNQSRDAFRPLEMNSKENIANASAYIEARRDQENKIKDFLKGMRLKSARNDPEIAQTFDSKHTLPHNYFLKPSLGAPTRTQKGPKEIKLKRSVLENDCLNITAPTNLEMGHRGCQRGNRRMSIDTTGCRSKSDSREELKISHRNRSKKGVSTKGNTSGMSSHKRTVLGDYHNKSTAGYHSHQHNTSTTTAKSRERTYKHA